MTSSLPAYLTDPLTLEFEAQILETFPLPGQRQGILLDQTYFYPTGGGQEHDTGFLGESAVLDVYKDDAGRIVHVVADLPPGPRAAARIDHDRRLRHTQHHTVQHLLSQCFLQLLEIRSVSVNINGYSPSTLDLAVAALSKALLASRQNMIFSVSMLWFMVGAAHFYSGAFPDATQSDVRTYFIISIVIIALLELNAIGIFGGIKAGNKMLWMYESHKNALISSGVLWVILWVLSETMLG